MGVVGGMFWRGGFIFLLVFFLRILSGGLGEMLGILSWCVLLLDLFSTSKGSASSSVECWLFLGGLSGSGHHQLHSNLYLQPRLPQIQGAAGKNQPQ